MKRMLIIVFALVINVLADEKVYVVQSLDESLAEINLTTGNVNPHVLDLGAFCNEIVSIGSRLYVTNTASLQEIDTETNSTLRDMALPGCTSPWTCAMMNADTMIITCWLSDNAVLLRLSDGQVVGELFAGNGPEGILVFGSKIFITATNLIFPNYGPGYVLVYDRMTLSRVDSLVTGVNPQFSAVDSQGRLHVVCTGDYQNTPGQVDVFDVISLSHIATLSTGGTPSTVSFGGGTAYLASGGWGDRGLVLAYSLATLEVTHGVSDPITTSPGAIDTDGNIDGSFLVSCFDSDIVETRSVSGDLLNYYLLADGPGYMARVGGEQDADFPRPAISNSNNLIQVFPNPFNSHITFAFSTRTEGAKNITLFNEIGQIVDRVLVEPGVNEVTWYCWNMSNGSSASGVFFAVTNVGEAQSAIPLIYIK